MLSGRAEDPSPYSLESPQLSSCQPSSRVRIDVLDKAIALDASSQFAIREGSRTIGSGRVTEVAGATNAGAEFALPLLVS